jgi:starvation-inducible DNA-binding protein
MTDRVAKDLCHLLADTYTLYLKTQNFHWNVTGELFFMLHAAFEEQYKALAEAIDLLAERLRALNCYAPGSYQQFQEIATIKSRTDVPQAKEMIRELLEDHEHLVKELERMIQTADEKGDQATMDMMIERQTEHQKTAWMLRSNLRNPE